MAYNGIGLDIDHPEPNLVIGVKNNAQPNHDPWNGLAVQTALIRILLT